MNERDVKIKEQCKEVRQIRRTAEDYADTVDYKRNPILTKAIVIDIFNAGAFSVPNDTELIDELQTLREENTQLKSRLKRAKGMLPAFLSEKI